MNNCIKSLCILWLCFCTCQLFAADEPRLYTGKIQVPGFGAVEMSLGILDSDEGTFILLTVPLQGTENVPLPATFAADGALVTDESKIGVLFTIAENEDFTVLAGKMVQQGITFQIEFVRVNSLPTINRPQKPVEPFPYSSREVTSLHPDGHLLAGTLTVPQGEGPFPCAILISGSGQQDRDESLMGHQPFLVLSDALTRRGIAVLRFDDRGVGGSVMEDLNDLQFVTSEDFATDVEVMVHAARIHTEIDAQRVGVIGHSEGGLIGPMVAANDDNLAFVVMLAGPGVSGQELLPIQTGMLLAASGSSPEVVKQSVDASKELYKLIIEGAAEEELQQSMAELVRLSTPSQGTTLTDEDVQIAVEAGLGQLNNAWFRFFLEYDPAPVLAQVRCPILALNGTLDVQVSFSQNLPRIERAVHDAGGDITIVEFVGLNHLFQPAVTGSVSEYVTIETTIEPVVLTVISDWLNEVTNDD